MPTMHRPENHREVGRGGGKQISPSKTIGRSTLRPVLNSGSPKPTTAGGTLRLARTNVSSNQRPAATYTSPTTTSLRKGRPPVTSSISLRSPTTRLAHAKQQTDREVLSYLTGPEPPLGTRKLQVRPQSSVTRLTQDKKTAASYSTGSPRVSKTARDKESAAPRQETSHCENPPVFKLPSKRLPIRGSIIPRHAGNQYSLFDQDSASSSTRNSSSSLLSSSIEPNFRLKNRSQADDSDLVGWELIDWPWVTPYAPVSGPKVESGLLRPREEPLIKEAHARQYQQRPGKQRYRVHASKHKLHGSRRRSGIAESKNPLHDFAGIESPFSPCVPALENGITVGRGQGDGLVGLAIDVRRRSQIVEPEAFRLASNSTTRTSNIYGVVEKVTDELSATVASDPEDSLQTELARSLKEFTKVISRMKDENQRFVMEFWEALRNIEEGEERCDMECVSGSGVGRFRNSTEDKDVLTISPHRKLNPAAEAFSLDTRQDHDHIENNEATADPLSTNATEPLGISMVPPQEKTMARLSLSSETSRPLQERTQAVQNSHPAVVNRTELGGAENRQISARLRPAAKPAHELAHKLSRAKVRSRNASREPVWVQNVLSAAKKLNAVSNRLDYVSLETPPGTYTGAAITAFPIVQYPVPDVLAPGCSEQDLQYLLHSEAGPGRVAKALNPDWARRRLEAFKERYPLTGMAEIELLTPVSQNGVLLNNKFAADIQQRLEFVLFQQKEKKAMEELTLKLMSEMQAASIL